MAKLKSLDIKKIIKVATLLVGFVLIVFISFFHAKFDFSNFDWYSWLADSSILVGIMIFGIIIGNSSGTDIQKDKANGRFQIACSEYLDILKLIEPIRIYFSQFWLKYKVKKLKEKKIDYLVTNQFDIRVATIIVNNIEKEDLSIGKLQIDYDKPTEKIYVKNDIKLKKLNEDEIAFVKKTFDIKLDTFGESYYLVLFDDGDTEINEAEKGKKIAQKIERDKKLGLGLKIVSSLLISIVWSALTIEEFLSGGGDDAVKKAWLKLISRITALITSFVSGYSTSVINVRDQANAIENKTNILKDFKQEYDNKTFIPETYEQMIEREYQEQIKNNKTNIDLSVENI